MATDSSSDAFARYNARFDSRQYSAIAVMLAADLRAERDSPRVSHALNLVIDACLGICGSPTHKDAHHVLAVFCGQNNVSIGAIDKIFRYLLHFDRRSYSAAVDFECTAKALLAAFEVKDRLSVSASCANGIHSWQGRMAYDLLVAADFLAQAAIQLLQHGNESYIHEKIQQGLCRLVGAFYEGIRHSDSPMMFSFRGILFPDESDRTE